MKTGVTAFQPALLAPVYTEIIPCFRIKTAISPLEDLQVATAVQYSD